MKKIILISIALLMFTVTNVNGSTLKGIVFNDENKNGFRDNNELGIEGVKVSDGFNIVQTNANGEFILNGWENNRFVCCYKPADYNIEQWYYRISDTAQYTFALTKKEKKESVSFLHISDSETYEHRDWVDDLKHYAEINKPDFIVHTGDICYERGLKWHSKNINTQSMKTPFFYTIGNHDLVKGDYGEQMYEDELGPCWYAFEEGNVLFVMTPMMHGDHKPSYNYEIVGGWIKKLMNNYSAEQTKIFFNHDLLTNGSQFNFKINDNEKVNLNDYNLKGWVYGHWHNNMSKEHGNSGIKSFCTSPPGKGGIDHSPSCFRTIDIDSGGNISSDLHWTYLKRSIQITSPLEKIALQKDQSISISINTYDSRYKVESVSIRLQQKGKRLDWHDLSQKENWINLKQQTDFNWRCELKLDTAISHNWEIVAKALLQNGDKLTVQKKFTIDDSTLVNPIEDWSNLLKNASHNTQSELKYTDAPTLMWTTNIKGNIYMTSPVVSNGVLVTASFDDGNNTNCYIVGLDAKSGKELWRYKTKNSVKNTIVIAKGIVVACDMQGYTYGVNLKTGELLWETDLEYNVLPGFVSGIVTDGEIVYVGFKNSLSALNVDNGSIIWKNSEWSGGEGSVPTMTLADDVLIVSSHWRFLYAHDAKTGKLLWKQNKEKIRFRDGTASFVDGYLWLTCDENLLKLNYKTGEVITSHNTGLRYRNNSAPVFTSNYIITGSADPGVAAFDRNDFSKKWLFKLEPALFYTPPYLSSNERTIESTPVVLSNCIFFGAMDGNIYFVDSETGKQLHKVKLGVPIMTTAAVSGNSVFIADFAGNVYCFAL